MLTSRFGRGPVLWVSITITVIGILISALSPVTVIFIDLMLFSAGFFAAHAIASSWVGIRARRAKGQASSLYLFCYYAGSNVAGTLGGMFWHRLGWYGVVRLVWRGSLYQCHAVACPISGASSGASGASSGASSETPARSSARLSLFRVSFLLCAKMAPFKTRKRIVACPKKKTQPFCSIDWADCQSAVH